MTEYDRPEAPPPEQGEPQPVEGSAALRPVRATGRAIAKSPELARDAAQLAIGAPIAASLASFNQLKSLGGKGVDTLFPECPVAAFMLPTGPKPDDYVIVFDLTEFLTSLQTGIFVRPKIELWAASAKDHDVQRLSTEVVDRFIEDFSAAWDAARAEGETAVATGQQRQELAVQELKDEATGPTLRSAGLWTAAAAAGAGGVLIAPVGLAGALMVPALMIAFGMKPRMEVFGRISDYFGARGDRADAEKALRQEMKRQATEFKRKRKALTSAVGRLEIHVHPRLRQLADACGAALDDADAPTAPAFYPTVEPYLEHPLYVRSRRKRAAVTADAAGNTDAAPPESGDTDAVRGFFSRLFGGK